MYWGCKMYLKLMFRNFNWFLNLHFVHTVHHVPSFYLPTLVPYTVFLRSHISFCFNAFWSLLTPSSGSLNPTTVPSQHIKCLCALITFNRRTLMIQKMVYLWKSAIVNRQLLSSHKHLMCCEGNVVGLRLPKDGVNQRNA